MNSLVKRGTVMKKNMVILVVVLSISVGLIGQEEYLLNSFEPEIIDARAEALGRTSILSTSGANYLFNNPSMLCKLTNRNIQISGRAIYGNTNLKQKLNEETYNLKTEYPLNMKITGFSIGIPYKNINNPDLMWGFGIGYRSYYDWGHKETCRDTYLDYEAESITTGGFSTLVLGSAINYRDKVSGGITFSFPVFSNSSHEFQDNYEAYKSEGELKGSFFTFSCSYFLHKSITMGARFRTGFTLLREGEFGNGDKYKYDYLIPSELGVALKVIPYDKLRIFAEFLTRNFGKFEYEIGNNSEIYSLYNDSNNGFSFRTGLEFVSIITFRSGFFIQSVPIYKDSLFWSEEFNQYVSNFSETPELESGFTAGLGIKIGSQIHIDLSGTYSSLIFDKNYDYYGYEYVVDHILTRFKIGCTIGYFF